MKYATQRRRIVWLPVLFLLLSLSCSLSSGPTRPVLTAPGITQIQPSRDLLVGGLIWSSKGTKLALSYSQVSMGHGSDPALFQIQILDVKSKEMELIEESNAGRRSVTAWLPDEKLIAYTYREKVSIESPDALYIMRSDGTCPVQIVETQNGTFSGVSWSPDGRSIALAWDEGIYLLEVAKVPLMESLKGSSACP